MEMGTNRLSMSLGNQEMLEPEENGAHLDSLDLKGHVDREDHGVPKGTRVSRVSQDLPVFRVHLDPRQTRCTSQYQVKRDLPFDQSL